MEPVVPTDAHTLAGQQLRRAESIALTDPGAALALIEELDLRRLRVVAPAQSGRAHYLHARLLSDQGEYNMALRAIRAARHDWLAAGLDLDATRTDLGRANVLIELGQQHEAIAVCQQLLARLDRYPQGDRDVRLTRAGVFSNLGTARNLMGEHRAAMVDFDVAANLYCALGMRDRQAEMDASRATASLRIGMVHRAVGELRRARDTLRELGQVLPAAKCSIDLSEGLLSLGRPVAALSNIEDVVSDLEHRNAFPELARLRVVRSHALLQLGRYGDAHDQAMVAVETFRELTMDTEAARGLHAAGWSSLESGDHARADEELGLAERLFANSQDPAGQAAVWLLQARLLDLQGQRSRALGRTLEALARLEQDTTSGPGAAHAHLLLAELVTDIDSSSSHLRAASDLIAQFALEPLRMSLELVRAKVQHANGDLPAAAHILTEALVTERSRLIESGRFLSTIGRGGDLLRAVTDELVSVLIQTDTSTSRSQAWQVATMAKSMMHEQLTRTAGAGVEDGMVSAALMTLSHMYEDLHEVPPGNGRRLMERMVLEQQRLLSRRGLIKRSEISSSADLPVTARVPETSILQYHVIGRDIAVFVVRDGGVSTRILAGAAERSASLIGVWERECERLRCLGEASADEPAHEVRPLMRAFHELLVAPVIDLLEDLDGEPLMLSLDQHLIGAPFEAFDTDTGPLSQRFSLYFCAGLETEDGATSPDTPHGLVVFAASDDRAPHIAQEAEAIAAMNPEAQVFIDDRATAEALREHVRGRDVVHLGCHGEYQAENPIFSAIRLQDRWVTGAEIMGLDLSGSLVVVGACDAGRSSARDAEPLGLVWSFLCAGSRAVVAPKWAVDDGAGAEFMVTLHEQLAAGVPDRIAVDNARSELIRHRPHPYHWAAFRYICPGRTAIVQETYR